MLREPGLIVKERLEAPPEEKRGGKTGTYRSVLIRPLAKVAARSMRRRVRATVGSRPARLSPLPDPLSRWEKRQTRRARLYCCTACCTARRLVCLPATFARGLLTKSGCSTRFARFVRFTARHPGESPRVDPQVVAQVAWLIVGQTSRTLAALGCPVETRVRVCHFSRRAKRTEKSGRRKAGAEKEKDAHARLYENAIGENISDFCKRSIVEN